MVPFVTMGDVFQWDDRVAAAAPPREPAPPRPRAHPCTNNISLRAYREW